MADDDVVIENCSQKTGVKREEKAKLMCAHCSKITACAVRCGKCEKHLHSSCLIQSATQKSAKCRHVPAYACDDFWETEKTLYQMIIKHLEEKNQILIENNELLKKNQEIFTEKLKSAELEVRSNLPSNLPPL